jgi:hypothetical protein
LKATTGTVLAALTDELGKLNEEIDEKELRMDGTGAVEEAEVEAKPRYKVKLRMPLFRSRVIRKGTRSEVIRKKIPCWCQLQTLFRVRGVPGPLGEKRRLL